MAVKIRLKRMGKVRAPHYRIVVVDSRKKRDGKVIEEIGLYHPKEDPSYIRVVSDRAQYWLGVGAQPSDAVAQILKITGDWQKFKGYKNADGTLRVAEPKRDKLEIFNEALKDAASEPKAEAVTKRAAKKSATRPAREPKADNADKGPKADKAAGTAPVESVEPSAQATSEATTEGTRDVATTATTDATTAEQAARVPAVETPEGAADAAETAEAAQGDAEAKKDEA